MLVPATIEAPMPQPGMAVDTMETATSSTATGGSCSHLQFFTKAFPPAFSFNAEGSSSEEPTFFDDLVALVAEAFRAAMDEALETNAE